MQQQQIDRSVIIDAINKYDREKHLPMFTIYDRTIVGEDHEIRMHIVESGQVYMDKEFCVKSDLETCRNLLQSMSLYNLGRNIQDAPDIVETWI